MRFASRVDVRGNNIDDHYVLMAKPHINCGDNPKDRQKVTATKERKS
jgi:hypothetical protein